MLAAWRVAIKDENSSKARSFISGKITAFSLVSLGR